MDLFLKDKSALVTGSSKGIGLAVAKSLAAEGCHLHLASRTENDLEAVASEIRDMFGVDVTRHVVDLSQMQDQVTL
ncbi:MAG: SDR family NAD(P)-dependent oxidoreductase, partial [Rhodospirillales bacterium]|nr:SDR family NAD(P)-dependent oxidoreductase [Rhodospirillales bacterium]